MDEDERYELWRAWLERITHQVYGLFHHRHLYQDVRDMARNADLPPSAFFEALSDWYAITQAVAIRRQLDHDQRSISLVNLLVEIADHPEVMTRERHVAIWTAGDNFEFAEHDASRNFDRFAAAGSDMVDADAVRADVERLEQTAAIVQVYVNKSVAHTDATGPDQLPTYAEMHESIDVIGELLTKYTSLLRATILWELTPVIQHDWRAPFRQPWLPEGSEEAG